MMGFPKPSSSIPSTTTTTKNATYDISEDDHANRKRERETSADLLSEHHDELEEAPLDAEGVCPPKKRGKETEEDSETTTVRKNMEEMVCQDQAGGDAEETHTGELTAAPKKNPKVDIEAKPSEEGEVSEMTGEETTVHRTQIKSAQSSSKAAFIPSKGAHIASKSEIPPSSTPPSSYTLPESSFSRNKEAAPSATSSTPISNPFLKNVGRTNDDEEEDVDNVADTKNSSNTRTRENDDAPEPTKKKYAFGQTLGPGAADIGRSNPAIATAPFITNASSSSLTSTPSAFGAKYSGATFGSTAASGSSIFGSGSLGTAAASSASPFAALAAAKGSTTSLEQTSSVFAGGTTADANEDDDDKEDNSEEDDDASNGDDGAGAVFGSTNKALVPEQDVITGEEDEVTLHQVKGKLYAMEDGQWRERGGGNLKLKISMKSDHEEGKTSGRKPRLVMRTDAVLRLILNTPLFGGMAMKIVQEKFVIFGGIEKDGKPMSYGFRAPSPIAAADLCEAIDRALSEYL